MGAGRTMAPPAQQKKPAFNLDTFLKLCQPQIYRVDAPQPYVDGGRTTFVLPQTGVCSEVMVNIQGSITVGGTISGGKWQGWPYPAPFSLIRNLTLTSNQNLQLINISGWGWYKWIRERYGIDPFRDAQKAQYSSHWNTLLGIGAQSIQPGANVTAGTYPINITLPIPVAYNKELLTGLLPMQSTSIQYPISFQWGNITGGISGTGGTNDLFAALAGTGITVSASITVTMDAEIIKIPRQYPPNTSMFMSVTEATYPLNSGGNQVIRPAINDLFTMAILEFTNNGLPIDPAVIGETVWLYSGNNRKYDQDAVCQGGWDFWQKGISPVDGCLVWDLGARKGLIMKRDLYDAFNDTQVTDWQLQAQLPLSLSVVAPAQVTLVTEALRYVKSR